MDALNLTNPFVLGSFGIAAAYMLPALSSAVSSKARGKELQARAEAKYASCRGENQKVPALDLPSEKEQERIANMSAVELLEAMEAGKLTSTTIVSVFIKRSSTLGVETFNVAEENYEEAMAMAKDADERRKKPSKDRPVRRLEGLPISVKDQYYQKGFDATCGVACRTFQPADEDGHLLALLRAQGAIPFVRTNVPQLLMLPESENAIWGRSENPYDKTRTSGGSSGGEGGLLGLRCTPLGLGTDIGGSLRIPAHFCGTATLKPTPQRCVLTGLANPRKDNRNGQEAVLSAAGPMSRSVGDLHLVLEAWMSPEAFAGDPLTPPVLWDRQLASKGPGRKLRIGFFDYDGFFGAAQPCKRAVADAVERMKAAGHTLVPFDPPHGYRAAMTFYGLMSSDGRMRSFIEGLEGENLHSSYAKLHTLSRIPAAVKAILCPLLRLGGQKRPADLMAVAGAKDAYDFWQCVADRKEIQRAWMAAMTDADLDVLLCPGGALPAYPHGAAGELSASCSYTFLFNLLHFPAGSVPFTRIRAGEEVYEDEWNDLWSKKAADVMKGSAGLPVGVQVIGLPFKDELVLHAMHEVEKCKDKDA